MANAINPVIAGMQCIRCQTIHPLEDYLEGCPDCLKAGMPASVAPHYTGLPSELHADNVGDWLSYKNASGLGEGNTPLSSLPRVASALGITSLHSKNEFTNPTGSHKDRMGALIAQRARDIGATTLAVASSGNAGVSIAAYAARAGLDCIVVTMPDISPNWRRAIEMHGAHIVATEKPHDRWLLVARHARKGEWYPVTNYLTPPVGSNPFGVDAYRAIAFELNLQLHHQHPTDIVVPTARGDVLWGIAKGYVDLKSAGLLQSIPKVHAVEPFPRICRVRSGESIVGSFPGVSEMVSIGGDTVAFQSIHALEMTGGTAVAVDDDDAAADQAVLAREGLYLELSSAAVLTGLRRLISENAISEAAQVVLIATSHGYKEYARFRAPLEVIDRPEQILDLR